MAITYSIDGGADAAKFTINSTSGALTFKTAPDYENPGDANADNVYEVSVKATDAGGASSSKLVKVTVIDVAETAPNLPPDITSPGTVSMNENLTTVMTVTAVDPDDAVTPPEPPASGFDIPLSFNDPMFTSMSNMSSGKFMANNEVLTNKSFTATSQCTIIFNQTGTARISYCRTDGRNVACDAGILNQSGGSQCFIDHCYVENSCPTNSDGTHVDGLQTQRFVNTSTDGALIDIKNSYISVGGSAITACLFMADNWDGTLKIKDSVIHSRSGCPYGTAVYADAGTHIDVYYENVYFVTQAGQPFRFLNYKGGIVTIKQWTNVRAATLVNGVLTLGATFPPPTIQIQN